MLVYGVYPRIPPIHHCVGPTNFTPKMASRSVQPFCKTHGRVQQTLRPRYIFVMRCGLKTDIGGSSLTGSTAPRLCVPAYVGSTSRLSFAHSPLTAQSLTSSLYYTQHSPIRAPHTCTPLSLVHSHVQSINQSA